MRLSSLVGSFLQQCVELVQLSAYAATHLVAELEYTFVGDRVEREVAILAPAHEPAAQQHAEVLGDVLLGGSVARSRSPTVAGPSRNASSRRMRIGSPRTRKRSAINSTNGAGSGWGTLMAVLLLVASWQAR